MPRLAVEGIRKAYRPFLGAREVVALQDLSFRIEPGEVVGLLGPNGAGKTTTLMLCLGLLRPDRGRIHLFGLDPRRPASKTRVGFMPEESYFYRFFSTPEILRFYGKLFGLSGKTLGERIPALIERVGLAHAGKRRLRTFSKGMLRRVGLAQALINSPDLVILDEPTAGMDPIGTREVKDLIVELKGEGRAVLLSSHLLADVEDVCDRIILLHRGTLVCQGEVASILSRTAETSVHFADLSPEALTEVTRVAASFGARVVRAEPPRESLEEFFVRTIGQREPKA
jgi:ABC-2 type transport system ATP-binding protein